jgi:YkoY family integral membrane protein
MDFISEIFGHSWSSAILIILNLVLIESLLSVDNAAVLATMVMDLPKEKRGKALKYGIIGAYVFRGLCLLFAAWLINIWWLKPLGGAYLLYLAIKYFISKATPKKEDDVLQKENSKLYKMTIGLLGPFWSTVMLIEVMDLAFSIDNVFAAVAFTDSIYLIWIGVFIGILAMRFVAQGFVKLMERFPFLETAAFTVITILGLKLMISVIGHFYPCSGFAIFLEGSQACKESLGETIPKGEHEMVWGDLITSILSMAIFFIPVLYSLIFKRKKNTPAE